MSIVPLRDHPLMCHGRVKNWPPAWISSDGKTDHLVGEVGILREMKWSSLLKQHRCFPVIEYKNGLYIACLLFDDQSFCDRIFKILKEHIGHPIDRIGGLDLSYTM